MKFLIVISLMILNTEKCEQNNVKITGFIEECLDIKGDTQELIFSIENHSKSDFYIAASNLFFEFKIFDNQGERVHPIKKGETPFFPEIILVEQGKKEYKITFNILDNYALKNNDAYSLHLSYRNTQKTLNGKRLLVGEYNIDNIPLNTCR